jgi:hypothetical protein
MRDIVEVSHLKYNSILILRVFTIYTNQLLFNMDVYLLIIVLLVIDLTLKFNVMALQLLREVHLDVKIANVSLI